MDFVAVRIDSTVKYGVNTPTPPPYAQLRGEIGRWVFTLVWEVGIYPGLGGGHLPRFGRWAFTPVWEVGVYPGLGGGRLPWFGRWAFTPVWEVGVYPGLGGGRLPCCCFSKTPW